MTTFWTSRGLGLSKGLAKTHCSKIWFYWNTLRLFQIPKITQNRFTNIPYLSKRPIMVRLKFKGSLSNVLRKLCANIQNST